MSIHYVVRGNDVIHIIDVLAPYLPLKTYKSFKETLIKLIKEFYGVFVDFKQWQEQIIKLMYRRLKLYQEFSI